MLLSSRRRISDFSSAAGDVRLQIATTRTRGQPAGPVTAVERQGIETIRSLIRLGDRFGHDPEGHLNFTGSTPEEIDLVKQLERLLPGRIEEVRGSKGIDLRKWSTLAGATLDSFEQEAKWDELPTAQREFIEEELEPFLIRLLNVAPENEEE